MELFRQRLFIAFLVVNMACTFFAFAIPIASPQDIEIEMRQVPQTHCLRFRKFDLIKRCRRYRSRRHR